MTFTRSLVCLVFVGLGTGCAAKDAGAGYRPIFNGRDLRGWTVKCRPADRAHVFFTVEDGAIVADSMGVDKHDYVWLVSDQEYGDFELRLKFQAYRGNPGNSGVQIRSRYDDVAGWLDGPQIDINPPGPWRTGMIWDETRGVQHWLYPAVPKGQWVNEGMAKAGMKFYYSDDAPPWNELVIRAVGTKVTAALNGVQVTDYDGAGVLDDAVHNGRRTGMKGHIALQIHTGDKLRIKFKDIEVKPLSR